MARPKKGVAVLSQPRPRRAAAVSSLFGLAERYIELIIFCLSQQRIKPTGDTTTIAPVSSKGQFTQDTSHAFFSGPCCRSASHTTSETHSGQQKGRLVTFPTSSRAAHHIYSN